MPQCLILANRFSISVRIDTPLTASDNSLIVVLKKGIFDALKEDHAKCEPQRSIPL